MAEKLLASEKDRAELLMIVDLERNDLGKVCKTVVTEEIWGLESHPRVHHLVGTVRGRMRSGTKETDLIRAAFPGGSITGAPKRRAMEIIAELEPVPRGVYTGCLGYFGYDRSMQFNIVIRTLTFQGGFVDMQVGGGIVADSDAEAEYRETLDKSAGLLEAIGAAGETGEVV